MLELKKVSIAYGSHEVVHQVSLHMREGESLSIVGESGCGKSTLIRSIVSLLGTNGNITEGRIIYKGEDITNLPQTKARSIRGREIALLYQNAGSSMDPSMKIGKQFLEALRTKGNITRKESDHIARSYMEKLLLKNPDKILNNYPVRLSGGMNQRVALAMTMAMEPGLILADEPTSALDVTAQVEVVRTMQKLREESHASLLMVTHNFGVVAQLADRVAVMYGGRIVEEGTADQILRTPEHPYTKILIQAVKQIRVSGTATPSLREMTDICCPYHSRCPHATERCHQCVPPMVQKMDGHRIRCFRTEGEPFDE